VGLVIAMLLAMVVPVAGGIAPEVNGARRWLLLGPVAFQPSELAKLALVIWTAALVVKKQDRLRSLSRGLGPFLIVWGMVAGLDPAPAGPLHGPAPRRPGRAGGLRGRRASGPLPRPVPRLRSPSSGRR
jgi:hypothetical protein